MIPCYPGRDRAPGAPKRTNTNPRRSRNVKKTENPRAPRPPGRIRQKDVDRWTPVPKSTDSEKGNRNLGRAIYLV